MSSPGGGGEGGEASPASPVREPLSRPAGRPSALRPSAHPLEQPGQACVPRPQASPGPQTPSPEPLHPPSPLTLTASALPHGLRSAPPPPVAMATRATPRRTYQGRGRRGERVSSPRRRERGSGRAGRGAAGRSHFALRGGVAAFGCRSGPGRSIFLISGGKRSPLVRKMNAAFCGDVNVLYFRNPVLSGCKGSR